MKHNAFISVRDEGGDVSPRLPFARAVDRVHGGKDHPPGVTPPRLLVLEVTSKLRAVAEHLPSEGGDGDVGVVEND